MQQEQLVQSLRLEPSETLSVVFDQNRATLRRFVMARMAVDLKGRMDASDIVQDTFAEAFKRLGDYLSNPSIPFLKWLFLLAEQNTALAYRKHVSTHKRSTSREQAVNNGSQSLFPNDLQRLAVCDHTGPIQNFEKLELKFKLEQAISMLPVPSQAVVRMRFIQGRSLNEISETLGISVDAVSKRAMRSLMKLSGIADELGLNDRFPVGK